MIKNHLKELNRIGFHDIEVAEIKAHHEMMVAQLLMHQSPDNVVVAEAKIQEVKEYKLKHQALIEFLQQRPKMSWMKNGDENTKLFQ